MTYFIRQIHQFISNDMDDKTLRQQLKAHGVDARRLSRFTQLALLGALPLKPYLTEKSGIYLGSPFNSPGKFDKMFRQLTAQNLSSPLDFMANINNAATFQLAQTLQIHGNSLFGGKSANHLATVTVGVAGSGTARDAIRAGRLGVGERQRTTRRGVLLDSVEGRRRCARKVE